MLLVNRSFPVIMQAWTMSVCPCHRGLSVWIAFGSSWPNQPTSMQDRYAAVGGLLFLEVEIRLILRLWSVKPRDLTLMDV